MFTNWKKHSLALGAMIGIVGLGSIAVPHKVWAQAKAALIRDQDNAARGAFQYSVDLNITGPTTMAVPIPAGYRLVVDFIAINGTAQAGGGGIQPSVVLSSTVGSTTPASYYFPVQQSAVIPVQYQTTQPATIYADSLGLALAYSGYAPAYLVLHVAVSGHLISMP
jgi:hypothetical protein